MGKFFVSVELAGDPDWQIYPSVDALLGGKGFMRQVTASEGTVCALPSMLYVGDSELPSESLAQQISTWIRSSLWPDTIVFVIAAGEWGVQYP